MAVEENIMRLHPLASRLQPHIPPPQDQHQLPAQPLPPDAVPSPMELTPFILATPHQQPAQPQLNPQPARPQLAHPQPAPQPARQKPAQPRPNSQPAHQQPTQSPCLQPTFQQADCLNGLESVLMDELTFPAHMAAAVSNHRENVILTMSIISTPIRRSLKTS